LKNLVWWNNVEVDSFFPKCFDLTEGDEAEDFKNEFRFIKVNTIFVNKYFKAECILKNFMRDRTINHIEKLMVAIQISEKRLKDVDD